MMKIKRKNQLTKKCNWKLNFTKHKNLIQNQHKYKQQILAKSAIRTINLCIDFVSYKF